MESAFHKNPAHPIIIIEFALTVDNYTKAYEAFVSHHSNTV